jgi:hypothetical protein
MCGWDDTKCNEIENAYKHVFFCSDQGRWYYTSLYIGLRKLNKETKIRITHVVKRHTMSVRSEFLSCVANLTERREPA